MMRILRKGEGYALSRAQKIINYLSIYNRKSGLVTLLISLFCFHFVCFAQSSRLGGTTGIGEIKPLIVHQNLPIDFWTKEHLFYVNGDTVRKNLEEYKGKLLLIDFWATWCGSCIKRFPQLDSLNTRYKEDVQILLVNTKKGKDTPEKIKSHWNINVNQLKLPTILDDHFINGLFPHYAIPYYVWIDRKGTVIAITHSQFINEVLIKSFI